MLCSGEVGECLSPEGGTARLAGAKPLIPLDEPQQCFISGDLRTFRDFCHCLVSWRLSMSLGSDVKGRLERRALVSKFPLNQSFALQIERFTVADEAF